LTNDIKLPECFGYIIFPREYSTILKAFFFMDILDLPWKKSDTGKRLYVGQRQLDVGQWKRINRGIVMTVEIQQEQIDIVKGFNRFFIRQMEVLRQGLLPGPYSFTEARILLELAGRNNLTAYDLGRELGLDPGYLNRILNRFEQKDLIEKNHSREDGGQPLIILTIKGEKIVTFLDSLSSHGISEMPGVLKKKAFNLLKKIAIIVLGMTLWVRPGI